jgi:hypothetical protein
LEPLRNATDRILEPDDINIIFSNIEVLYKFNKELLQQFEERTKVWEQHPEDPSKQLIGDIFVKLVPQSS